MSDLVGNPEDRFSHNEAHCFVGIDVASWCSGHYVETVIYEITVFKIFIWGGISSDIRSEILFYGDASAEP